MAVEDKRGSVSGLDDEDDSPTSSEEGESTAVHPSPADSPFLVAPATSDEFNTLRIPLLPIACWRLNAGHFDFDSSVVLPAAEREIKQLAALVASRPGAPASIFGHADPVGDDEYNKALSGRRALAIYALLIRDIDRWETLYQTPRPGDTWGIRSIQIMLGHITDPTGAPYYMGPIDGSQGSGTTAAIRAFQGDHGLTPDGSAGSATRAVIFRSYMDALAGDFTMSTNDFLGKAAANAKANCQGCSEFNPVRLLEVSANSAPDRNERNAPNRRVVLYLFRAGTMIDPAQWPCPNTGESSTGCRAQFWPDGNRRRAQRDAPREYRITRDTFACRFYDGLAHWSPCEGIVVRDIRIKLFDNLNEPMPRAKFLARFSGREERGDADDNAIIEFRRVVPPATIHLQWREKPDDNDPKKDDLDEGLFLYRSDVFITTGDDDTNVVVRKKLHNLGFRADATLADNVRTFQRLYSLPETGDPADIVPVLVDVHDGGAVKPFDNPKAGERVDNNP